LGGATRFLATTFLTTRLGATRFLATTFLATGFLATTFFLTTFLTGLFLAGAEAAPKAIWGEAATRDRDSSEPPHDGAMYALHLRRGGRARVCECVGGWMWHTNEGLVSRGDGCGANSDAEELHLFLRAE
jgi:hypothetical protein